MFKRNLTLVVASLFTAVAAPAFADNVLGSPADAVLNPNGKEVAQTAQGVGSGLGADVWYVQGSNARVASPTDRPDAHRMAESRMETGHAYSDPAFGAQADA